MPKEAIARKIEQMRKEPEHVRVRYVLVAVTISMTFVVVLWIFAIQDNVRKMIDAENPLSKSELFPQSNQQTLQDILQSAQNAEAINVPTQPVQPVQQLEPQTRQSVQESEPITTGSQDENSAQNENNAESITER